MSRFSLQKMIEKRHGEDPGMSQGFRRCYAGVVDARKGIKRVESLVKGQNGAREIAQVRAKLDEAEFWLAASIHGVRSEPWPKPYDGTLPDPEPDTCRHCGGDASDNSFDRSICPCGSMHTFHIPCGQPLDDCSCEENH